MLNIAGYHLWGLTGLGIAFLAWYVAYTVIVAVTYLHVFHLRLGAAAAGHAAWALLVTVTVMLLIFHGATLLATTVTAVSIIVACVQGHRLWKN